MLCYYHSGDVTNLIFPQLGSGRIVIMSVAEDEDKMEANTMMCCASCGKTEVDDVKLKTCTACKLVRYCSVDCQRNHRSQHKRACKKRAAEIRDDLLFTQPGSTHLGECPLCCVPLPLGDEKNSMYTCCCKVICKGCDLANDLREMEGGLEHKCPFCREPLPENENKQKCQKNLVERIKANDPVALCQMGLQCFFDEGDYEKAFEYHTRAAELGDMEAHYNLGVMYRDGIYVEKDEKKAARHWEEATIGGHPHARFSLACYEGRNGRMDRMRKHFIIAAKLGSDDALERLKRMQANGSASNEDVELALRGYQAAVDATKSQQRDAAEEHYKRQNRVTPKRLL